MKTRMTIDRGYILYHAYDTCIFVASSRVFEVRLRMESKQSWNRRIASFSGERRSVGSLSLPSRKSIDVMR